MAEAKLSDCLTLGHKLRKEDAAERAEQIEIGKTALSLAESERSKLFDSATSIDLQNLKNNAPKVGDTKFLVKKGDAMLSKNIRIN